MAQSDVLKCKGGGAVENGAEEGPDAQDENITANVGWLATSSRRRSWIR